MAPDFENVHIIINPAAGKDEPILNTINTVCDELGVAWTAHITHERGDATRLARKAVEDGADLIICYGGDGTLMEVVNGIAGAGVPLGILPGGTGNAVAAELGLPDTLREALDLALTGPKRRLIDLGRIDDRYFILRVFTGVSEEQVASREMKDRYGLLAYPLSVLKFLREADEISYRLVLDGEEVSAPGTVCYVNNVGSVGGAGSLDFLKPVTTEIVAATDDETFEFAIDPADGLLDVILVARESNQLLAAVSFLLNVGQSTNHVSYWQVKKLTLDAEPPQQVWLDGERFGQTPLDIEIVPRAVTIIVPDGG